MKAVSLVLVGDMARRALIKAGLRGRPDVTLAGEIGDQPALRLVPRLAPDIVVLDCGTPELNSLLVLPWLHMLPGAPRIIALGAIGSAAERQLLLELGAHAYVAPDDLGALQALLGRAAAPLPPPFAARAA